MVEDRRIESVVSDELYRKAAWRFHHRDGETEIDTEAKVSRHNDSDGAYVQAWVWITRDEVEAIRDEP